MANPFRTVTDVELRLLSYMFVECGPWALADWLGDMSRYYAQGSDGDEPAPSLAIVEEAYRFAADYMRADCDWSPCRSADPSSVYADLDAIIGEHKPKPFDYHAYLRSPEWKAKRDAQVEAAGGRCQVCNSAKQLNCHHRTYERIGNEIPDDLFVLCADCHVIFHENGRLARP